MEKSMQNWSPSSWRGKPIRHVPVYGHEAHLREVEKTIATYPPLVFAGEARDLKEKLALASQGKAFLLQGGDCAESFAEHNPDNIRDIFRLFLQMSAVLIFATSLPVIKLVELQDNLQSQDPLTQKKQMVKSL